MQVLDTTIANVSLPTIAGSLGVSSDTGTWIITAFAVANGVTVPLTGWLMQRFGVVRTFTFSALAFTFASFLCGIAWSLSSLVLFRVLQGAVSGPMIPGSQALLLMIFPAEKRGTALGIWSAMTLAAPIFGPVLGGYISDNYHWSWIFLINLPLGIATGTITWLLLSKRDTPTRKLPIDKVGLMLLTFWVFSMQTMLDLGKDRDWFHSTLIVVLGLCAAIGFVAWVIWELTDRHPAVDLTIFKSRNFLLGTVALCFGYALLFANNLLLPLWLQEYMGYTATWAGLVAAPAGTVAVLTTPLISKFKIDSRIMATISFLCFGASFLMRSWYPPDASFFALAAPLALQGVAMTTFFVPLLAIMLDGLPPERVPSATGISNFARITAGSFAASLVTTLWDRREALHQTRLAEAGSPYNPVFRGAVEQLGHAGMSEHQAMGAIGRTITEQGYLLASVDIFWASGWISLLLIGFVWFARKPTGPRHAVAAD
ncbi:DHA2 family efflux MFS transporter permease subunit [Altererythrobacter sp. B11]|uniref:DHA2 family efflux MFS transporter permease subunit n=1 Tax=Altererythrobacter sp. B11 TaxID=2060312 RepID=UPI000E5A3AA8|nr:DHA2 family efflux MFS transporter permease subunit [Altererythrobacter sp. B11]